MLLASMGGAERELEAGREINGVTVLNLAAACGSLATVRVLLSAGADETSVDTSGQRAADVVGLGQAPGEARDPDTEAAIRRALERGPAFRARSLAWEGRRSSVGSDRGRPAAESRAPLGAPVRLLRPRRRVSLARTCCR